MFPGRFPSPTTSRESTPFESIEDAYDVFVTTPNRSFGSDYTAPEAMRNRPRIAGVHSEPSISRTHGTAGMPFVSTPTPASRSRRERRVTDLPRGHSGHTISQSRVTNSRSQTHRRTVSDLTELSTQSQPPQPQDSHQDSHRSDSRQPLAPELPLSPKTTDIMLDELLRKPLNREDKEGVLYIISDPVREDLGYKIGFTRRNDYRKRIKEHARDCNFDPDVIYVSPQKIQYCDRTEKLVHADLQSFKHVWTCNTTVHVDKTHTEWFKVEEAFAVATVKKWEAFMETERPYDSHKNLLSIWTHLLRRRRRANPVTDDDDHDSLRARWAYITSPPTRVDRLRFRLHILLCLCQIMLATGCAVLSFTATYFWEIVAAAVVFTLAVYRDTFMARAVALVSVYACFKFKITLPKKPRGKRAW
jgi:hypothetical protein